MKFIDNLLESTEAQLTQKQEKNKETMTPPDERHTNTQKLNSYNSTITDVFLNQKRVNVCEHTVKMAPHDTH